MTSQAHLVTACTTKKVRLMQRRAGVCLPCTPHTFHPPTGQRRADLWWEAMVVGLQPTKAALIVGRRFEPGSLLEVEIAAPSGPAVTTQMAQATEIKPQETGGYLIQALFVPPLADDVFASLR